MFILIVVSSYNIHEIYYVLQVLRTGIMLNYERKREKVRIGIAL